MRLDDDATINFIQNITLFNISTHKSQPLTIEEFKWVCALGSVVLDGEEEPFFKTWNSHKFKFDEYNHSEIIQTSVERHVWFRVVFKNNKRYIEMKIVKFFTPSNWNILFGRR